MNEETPRGDELLRVLTALANPQRLRIVGILTRGRQYVSRLARELGISRPLLYVHLHRLEAAGLVVGVLETAGDGKTMKYYRATQFAVQLTPHTVMRAATTLGDHR
ncbi:ArsR/SmtB family transcription factor [Amycolatopsis cihanbeyliensis]|uniref:ArsR family transcriptional regulator n=1 Tax=Amycolatopsis cihanbeyliensis TaxID=1128664 RepID=A0A542DJV7_AMYCI|nr:winged helix-turn-helix domain-containing protein [Amycolatopsis cihanbeyliensis]TQJ03377.1 ArsR family transcriptional regulator [Amycolatopsis cihanbeyliensis]